MFYFILYVTYRRENDPYLLSQYDTNRFQVFKYQVTISTTVLQKKKFITYVTRVTITNILTPHSLKSVQYWEWYGKRYSGTYKQTGALVGKNKACSNACEDIIFKTYKC